MFYFPERERSTKLSESKFKEPDKTFFTADFHVKKNENQQSGRSSKKLLISKSVPKTFHFQWKLENNQKGSLTQNPDKH